MLFSIIVPVYNVCNYIQECIDSITNQIEKDEVDAEIILIDDGSTDTSGQICDLNVKNHPNIIRVLHKKNEGLLCARREGFSLARGKYIINCDSDDILADGALQVLKKTVEKYSPDIILYNMGIYDGTEKKDYYNNCFTNDTYVKINKEQVMTSYFTDDVPVVTSMASKAIRTSCIDLNKDYSDFYGSSFGEDTLQSAEVYERAENIVYINQVLYYYRISIGMSSKFNENYYDDFLRVIRSASTYYYINSNDKYHSWLTIKLLKTLARSITQSKNSKGMNYKKRKDYFESLFEKDGVKEILDELNQYRDLLSTKYWMVLVAFKHKLFFVLHAMLSI